MDATSQGIDARGYLTGWLQGVTSMYLSDIRAIPEDKLSVSPGGAARSVDDISVDALDLLTWTTEALKGNFITEFDQEARKARIASMNSHEAIAEAFNKAAEDMSAALAGASDEALNGVIKTPFGMEMPLFMVATIAVNHIWYHDGQLNYFQALNGDSDIHWQMN